MVLARQTPGQCSIPAQYFHWCHVQLCALLLVVLGQFLVSHSSSDGLIVRPPDQAERRTPNLLQTSDEHLCGHLFTLSGSIWIEVRSREVNQILPMYAWLDCKCQGPRLSNSVVVVISLWTRASSGTVFFSRKILYGIMNNKVGIWSAFERQCPESWLGSCDPCKIHGWLLLP